MNVITGKQPIAKLRGFNGLYLRGSDDTCPQDHLTECYNCSFPGVGQIAIREPWLIQNDIANRTIVSFAVANVTGGACLLTLNSDGKFFNESVGPTLLGTFVGADDFVCLNIYGRAYITFKSTGRAYSGGTTYYFDGSNFIAAAGAAPVAAATLAQPNAGLVNPGVHTVWVCFLTRTGYVTKPGPSSTITSTGSNTISLSVIPTGPAGTVGRVLLISRANETQAFFVPSGTINDNVTTTFEYTSDDSALIDSADYLFDNIASLPSAAAIKFYNGRIILVGRDGSPDSILASNIASPETFNLTTNVINLPQDFGANTATGGLVIRDVLYITKPNGTFSVQDNENDPGTWNVSIIDSGIGAFDVGVSIFASAMSGQDTLDSCMIAHARGLVLFNGTFSDVPLTWKIESLWQQIDKNLFYKVQVAHDIWAKRVYVSIPLTGPTGQSLVLMMDYQEGLDPYKVKWSPWFSAAPNAVLKIAVENFTLTYAGNFMIYNLAIATGLTILYKVLVPNIYPNVVAPDQTHSGTVAINQFITTATIAPGGIVNFSCLDMTFSRGSGILTPTVLSKTRATSVNYKTFNLGSYTPINISLQRLINVQSEAIQVKLTCNAITAGGVSDQFFLTALDVYGTIMFAMQPAYLETA